MGIGTEGMGGGGILAMVDACGATVRGISGRCRPGPLEALEELLRWTDSWRCRVS